MRKGKSNGKREFSAFSRGAPVSCSCIPRLGLCLLFIYSFVFFHLTIPEAFLLVLAKQALTWKLPLSHRDSLYSLQVTKDDILSQENGVFTLHAASGWRAPAELFGQLCGTLIGLMKTQTLKISVSGCHIQVWGFKYGAWYTLSHARWQ